MENNIFANAKFGDKFRTRDGRIALYIGKKANELYPLRLAIDSFLTVSSFTENGRWFSEEAEDRRDIVGKWEEPTIDENILHCLEEKNHRSQVSRIM